METKVTLFELIISCGGGIVAIVSAWIHMRMSVGQIKTEMEYIKKELEAEKQLNTQNYKEIKEDISSIFKILTEIKVSIASHK